MPAPIVDGLQKGVVAFTIAVSNLQGIRKLGQDKQPHDVRGVIEGLRGQGRAEGLAVATAMALACQKDD